MNDNVLEMPEKKRSAIVTLQEALLMVFIVLSPIYRCFGNFTLFGFNPIVLVIGMLLATYVINSFYVVASKQKRFFSFVILIVLCLQLIFSDRGNYIGWILPMFMYAFFLQTDEQINLGRVNKAVLLSSVIAAVFSVIFGFAGGVVTRVATTIDGSIAPIAISIVLFGNTEKQELEGKYWNLWKLASVLSSVVVLIFGMSRARFLIIIICLILYLLSMLWSIIKNNGKASRSTVLTFFIIMLLITIAVITGMVSDLFQPIIRRFLQEGLDSLGRDYEMRVGLRLFEMYPFWGGGWSQLTFQDPTGSIVAYNNHCAYVAILARGGLSMGIPVFLSYFLLIKGAWKIRKVRSSTSVLMLVFLLLSYGNAGMFNYTILSIIPLVVLNIKKESKREDQEDSLPAEG